MIDVLDNQMTIDQWLQNLPEHSHATLARNIQDGWQQPLTCDECDIAFGSLLCFERRGYFYLKARREFLKGSDGKPLISNKNRICKKTFGEDRK